MTEMTFDVPSFNSGSDGLNQKSSGATSDLTSGVTSNLAPPAASSPVGGLIATLTAQLQGVLGLNGRHGAVGVGVVRGRVQGQ